MDSQRQQMIPQQQLEDPSVVWPQLTPDRWHQGMPPMPRPPGPLPDNIAFDDLTRQLYYLRQNAAGERDVQRVFTLEEYNRYIATAGRGFQPDGISQNQGESMAYEYEEDEDDVSIDNGEVPRHASPSSRPTARNPPVYNHRQNITASGYAGITRHGRGPAPRSRFNSSGQGLLGLLTEAELDALPDIPNPNRTPTEQAGPDDAGPPFDDGPKKENEQKNVAVSRIQAARRYMGIKRKPAIPPPVNPNPRNTLKARQDKQAVGNKKLNDWHQAKIVPTSANYDANYRKKYFDRKDRRLAHNTMARVAGLQHRHNWERANGATNQQLSAAPDVAPEDDDNYYQDMGFFRARGKSAFEAANAARFTQWQVNQTGPPFHTQPETATSTKCQECLAAKRPCDIAQRGIFRCTRCESLRMICTDGSDSHHRGLVQIDQAMFASASTIATNAAGDSSPTTAALARRTNRAQNNSTGPSRTAASPHSSRSNRAAPYDIRRTGHSIRQARVPTPEMVEEEANSEEPCSNCQFDDRTCGPTRPCEQCCVHGYELTCDPSANPENNRWPFGRQPPEDGENDDRSFGAGPNSYGLCPSVSQQYYGSLGSNAGPFTSPYGMPPENRENNDGSFGAGPRSYGLFQGLQYYGMPPENRENDDGSFGAGPSLNGLGPSGYSQYYESLVSNTGPSTSPYEMPPGSDTGALPYMPEGWGNITSSVGHMDLDNSDMNTANHKE